MRVQRTDLLIKPDCRRVFFRPFNLSHHDRYRRMLGRVLALSEERVEQELSQVGAAFDVRHLNLRRFFLKRFEQVREFLPGEPGLSEARKQLIGAYFTQEYALESAALFNPSIVWHPDQSGLPPGSRRFILSLRAIGEGHISSITFRSGVVDANNRITLDTPTRFVTAPEVVPDPSYDKTLFRQKAQELGLYNEFTALIIEGLRNEFTLNDLTTAVERALQRNHSQEEWHENSARGLLSLAQSNYEVRYDPEQHLSERIIFPTTPAERNGIEDARFVAFRHDDGHVVYYATYTAFDGEVILPQLLETADFLRFRLHTLNGPAARNKNLALFPRKIDGRYAMISRQDNENIYIMFSDNIHFWYSEQLLLEPAEPWEFVQIGSCSPPLETEAGWLVLHHGVGPMRQYALGAFLLDRHDPTRVLGRLKEPLISPDENEREGYVPNVVYTCGALIHGDTLILPYSMSDYATRFATVSLPDLLEELLRS